MYAVARVVVGMYVCMPGTFSEEKANAPGSGISLEPNRRGSSIYIRRSEVPELAIRWWNEVIWSKEIVGKKIQLDKVAILAREVYSSRVVIQTLSEPTEDQEILNVGPGSGQFPQS